jgi:hypothetical protein
MVLELQSSWVRRLRCHVWCFYREQGYKKALEWTTGTPETCRNLSAFPWETVLPLRASLHYLLLCELHIWVHGHFVLLQDRRNAPLPIWYGRFQNILPRIFIMSYTHYSTEMVSFVFGGRTIFCAGMSTMYVFLQPKIKIFVLAIVYYIPYDYISGFRPSSDILNHSTVFRKLDTFPSSGWCAYLVGSFRKMQSQSLDWSAWNWLFLTDPTG